MPGLTAIKAFTFFPFSVRFAGMLNAIRIVLIETSHPGNIGAVARAMKNMALSDLCLVGPRFFPHEQASARASGAADLLARAKVVDTPEAAVADCRFVIGASARLRSVNWPQFPPRACARRALDETANGRVAILFGRENSGLTNAELDLCHYLVHIPTNPDYQSLNIAMAVQVIAYELYVAADEGARTREVPGQAVVDMETMERFYVHLKDALGDIGFSDPRQSEKLFRRLRRLFHRARLNTDEVQILRGVLSAAQGRKQRRFD